MEIVFTNMIITEINYGKLFNYIMRTQLTDLKKELAQIQTTLIQLKTKGSLTERIKKRLENRELIIKSIIFNIQ